MAAAWPSSSAPAREGRAKSTGQRANAGRASQASALAGERPSGNGSTRTESPGGWKAASHYNLGVDEHALRVLEYDKVLARLAKLASFAGGHDMALALRPSPDFEEVLRRQRLLAEAIQLRRLRTPLNLLSASDVRPAVEKAALGGMLDPHQLLEVSATQQVAEGLKAAVARHEGTMPLLASMTSAIAERRSLVTEINRSIDQRGEVSDNASPTWD